MQDNLYRKVEGMLYSYNKVKAKIENIKLEIEELNDFVGIKGAGDGVRGSTPTYTITSSVENEVIAREESLPLKIQKLERELRSKERFVRSIDNALNTLEEADLMIIQYKYFRKYSIDKIAELLDISDSTVQRNKKDAVLELMDIIG